MLIPYTSDFHPGDRDNVEVICLFSRVQESSYKNINNYFYILYFLYGTTFHRSQNNGITWQKWKPTFSFKIVLESLFNTSISYVIFQSL